jgi:hypothetical protein
VAEPVLHKNVAPPPDTEAVKTAVGTVQSRFVEAGETNTSGGDVFSTTVVVAIAVQPFVPVAVTEKLPAAVAEMVAVVSEVFQKKVVPAGLFAVKLIEVTAQVNSGEAGVMDVAGGVVFEVADPEAVAVQPFGPVTVTV